MCVGGNRTARFRADRVRGVSAYMAGQLVGVLILILIAIGVVRDVVKKRAEKRGRSD